MTQDDLTLRLIAGMTGDKRYEKECREVSERAESYSTCNSVFVQRAQALGNLTSTFKKKDEANALDTDTKGKGKSSKGGRGKGKGRGRGKGGKGAGTGSPSGYENTSKPVCYEYLAGRDCQWGDECRFEHVTQKQLDARDKKKKDKKTKTKKKPKKGETADQKAKRRKKQPCYSFQQTGAFANGKKCEYSHVAVLSDDSAESSNYVSSTTEINLWGRRGDAEKPSRIRRGVAYGPPEPELILSAAVIGVRGVRKTDKKRSPVKGGRSTGSDPKTVKDKARKHKRVSFTTSRAEIPYNSGTSRLIEGRKYQVGEGVEINLPDRPIDGVRCVILELWETKESIPYAKLNH